MTTKKAKSAKKVEMVKMDGVLVPLDKVIALAQSQSREAHVLMDTQLKLARTREHLAEVESERDAFKTALAADRRERLPSEREASTYHFTIHSPSATHKGYVTIGFYPDGRVGEIFFKMDRMGEACQGACDAWATAVSILLQNGMSLEAVVAKFRGMTFEPSGRTNTPGIRVALSPIDFVMRYLERRFVHNLPLADGEA